MLKKSNGKRSIMYTQLYPCYALDDIYIVSKHLDTYCVNIAQFSAILAHFPHYRPLIRAVRKKRN